MAAPFICDGEGPDWVYLARLIAIGQTTVNGASSSLPDAPAKVP
jgi:hypothetical protein